MSNRETFPENDDATMAPHTAPDIVPRNGETATHHLDTATAAIEALPPASPWLGALGVGLGFALVGSLFAVREIANATLPHILQPGLYIDFQEVDDSLPVPKLLDWNLKQVEALVNLQTLPPVAWFLLVIALMCCLWLIALFVLNPTFRLFIIGEQAESPSPPLSTREAQAESVELAPSEPEVTEDPTAFTVKDTPGYRETTSPAMASTTPDEPLSPPLVVDEPLSPPLPVDGVTPMTAVVGVETVPDAHDPSPPSQETVLTPVAPHSAINHAEVPLPLSRTIEPATAEIMRALTLLVFLGVPLEVFWVVTSWLGEQPALKPFDWLFMFVRFVALGLALWLGFHYDGAAGNFADGNAPLRPRNTADLVPAGLLYGLCLFALARWGLPGSLNGALLRYQMLGTFHVGYWTNVSLRYLTTADCAWFSAGVLLYLLGRPGLALAQRAAMLAVPVVALTLSWWAQQAISPATMAQQMDIRPAVRAAIATPYNPKFPSTGVPNGPKAGLELAKSAHIATGLQPTEPTRDLIIFYQNGPRVVRRQGVTEDGLSAGLDTSAPVRAFLEKRDYKTALSWVAIKHLFNVATLHFDPTTAIATCLTDLDRCPHAAQIHRALRFLLFTCAATPENLALLDHYADERFFRHPERASQRMMGDLYVRFGQVEKAMQWYRRAEMPKSFQRRVSTEKPLFHTGHLEGQIVLNGQPLVGARVGLLAQRMNGLPRDLEPALITANDEIIPPYGTPGFPPFHPRPYAFRLMSAGATTDAQGHFAMDNLTEGQYLFVVALPPNYHLHLPIEPKLSVKHPSHTIFPRYDEPGISLHTVEINCPVDAEHSVPSNITPKP